MNVTELLATNFKEHVMQSSSNLSRRNRAARVVGCTVGLAALTGSTLVLVSPAGGAVPAGGLTRGACSGRSTVTMQLQHGDPGRIEAGFEIDHARVGSVWRVRLTHNGVQYFLGNRTAAHDGTFSVDRILRDLRGTDTVSGRARNLSNGQVCTVTARI
jgi:hypothetical protein